MKNGWPLKKRAPDMKVYPDLSTEEIEQQYFLRGLRPDYDTAVIPLWIERSQALIAKAKATLDIPYGPGERNKLDFFKAENPNGKTILYIHGGYWQRGDKSVYSFLAEYFLDKGYCVAIMNYPMCPIVRFSEIVHHARAAVIWLWRNAESLGVDQNQICAIGHSAGGHLTAEMIFTDWQQISDDLPNQILKSGIALSGIYDLEPLLYCSENKGLRLDEDEVAIASPMYADVDQIAPMLIGFGFNEPPDMHRQSKQLFEKLLNLKQPVELIEIANADHFDVVNVLGEKNSELFKQILHLLQH